MAAVCRVGDTASGICRAAPHSGGLAFTATFSQGSSVCTADGLAVVLVGHTGPTSCGHTVQAIAGSAIVDVNGIPVVRVGDAVTIVQATNSTGTVTSGSPDVTAN